MDITAHEPVMSLEMDDTMPIVAAETLVALPLPNPAVATDDIRQLSARVHECLHDIGSNLDLMERELAQGKASADAGAEAGTQDICSKTATHVLGTIGFLNAHLAHFYTHPDYQASGGQKQAAMGKLLAFKNPQIVREGIAEMRAWVAAMKVIDLDKATEVPYENLYRPMTKKQVAASNA